MVVIDTNIVSELMRSEPSTVVLAWMDDRPARELFVTAITEAEVRTGIAVLPEGRRRRGLGEACERAFGSLFAGRVLPFDSGAARAYAEIVSARRVLGRPVSQADCQIAAIACARGMAVATRNVRGFEDMGIEILDPWNAA
ncbi:MAG: type II toxin-antitoxin system VapC family toxin [Bryobacterales bacterium]|nr:type II toxin-antitoxin system VapC family toxin [Bryobacterales bacterium]MDE0623232.1 type II toxin-antitoxin system VapC family toxin [Bryobacterales bacterium]